MSVDYQFEISSKFIPPTSSLLFAARFRSGRIQGGIALRVHRTVRASMPLSCRHRPLRLCASKQAALSPTPPMNDSVPLSTFSEALRTVFRLCRLFVSWIVFRDRLPAGFQVSPRMLPQWPDGRGIRPICFCMARTSLSTAAVSLPPKVCPVRERAIFCRMLRFRPNLSCRCALRPHRPRIPRAGV